MLKKMSAHANRRGISRSAATSAHQSVTVRSDVSRETKKNAPASIVMDGRPHNNSASAQLTDKDIIRAAFVGALVPLGGHADDIPLDARIVIAQIHAVLDEVARRVDVLQVHLTETMQIHLYVRIQFLSGRLGGREANANQSVASLALTLRKWSASQKPSTEAARASALRLHFDGRPFAPQRNRDENRALRAPAESSYGNYASVH